MNNNHVVVVEYYFVKDDRIDDVLHDQRIHRNLLVKHVMNHDVDGVRIRDPHNRVMVHHFVVVFQHFENGIDDELMSDLLDVQRIDDPIPLVVRELNDVDFQLVN